MPIVVLFFQENGLTMTEIFWLKSVYSIGIVAFEIPSGYFADIWGRKKTLIVGTLLTTFGFSIYGFSSGFWQFLIAELVLGIGQSFISGADSALLYDSLKIEKKENEYTKYEGRVISVGNFSEAIAGVLGGLLAAISLRTPFIAQAIVSAVAIPAALTLIEPPSKIKDRITGLKDIFNVLSFTLIENSRLRNFILFSSLIGAATLTFAWFIQPFLIEIKMPLPFFGVTWTILNLTVGFASIFGHRIEKIFNEKQTTGFIYISMAAGFVLTGLWISYYMLILVFFLYIIRGIATPVLKDYIHILINSDIRATVLSLRDMFIRIIFAMTGPVWGWVIDHHGLKSGFIIAGIFFFISGSILYYFSYYSKSSSKPS
jgi:MFS family permease